MHDDDDHIERITIRQQRQSTRRHTILVSIYSTKYCFTTTTTTKTLTYILIEKNHSNEVDRNDEQFNHIFSRIISKSLIYKFDARDINPNSTTNFVIHLYLCVWPCERVFVCLHLWRAYTDYNFFQIWFRSIRYNKTKNQKKQIIEKWFRLHNSEYEYKQQPNKWVSQKLFRCKRNWCDVRELTICSRNNSKEK